MSDDECIEYLKKSIRRIVQLGYDGIDFEESEEAFWYCDCDNCKENFLKHAKTPEEAKHIANDKLFSTLYKVIKKENPDCIAGIRAWRQPPLEKPTEVMEDMVNSVPQDVQLFWTPGLYVPESEFEKWTKAFGAQRNPLPTMCSLQLDSQFVTVKSALRKSKLENYYPSRSGERHQK